MVDLTLDTDNDGVFDLIDLDDDNDGLVDENEGAITSRYQVLDDQLYVFNATTGDLDPEDHHSRVILLTAIM